MLRRGLTGIQLRVFIDAAYGVHVDGKSHTGSCVVIGDVGAVHSKSGKQHIVTKSSTEAELVALSDSANQGLHSRNLLMIYCGIQLLDTSSDFSGQYVMHGIDRARAVSGRAHTVSIYPAFLDEGATGHG